MPKEALLVIDMLNDFVREGAPLEVPETRKIIPAIQREIERARKEGSPVIYACDWHEPEDREFEKMGWPPHAVKNTEGAEVVEQLKPAERDIEIKKTTYSAFYGSKLEETLKSLGVESLRLTGCVTNICVMFTAADAAMRDYDVTVVQDAVAGLNREDHEAGLRIMKNVLGAKLA